MSISCKDCNCNLIFFNILYVIQDFPVDVSTSGLSGMLKSPPSIRHPDVKLVRAFIIL